MHRSDSSFLELTDGGHFENLGLYELVRRKLEVILIVDGEEDPNIKPDLSWYRRCGVSNRISVPAFRWFWDEDRNVS